MATFPHRPLLEIAVDSVEDAVAACHAGADRLELVADLHTQGLTAPPELIRDVTRACAVPVMAMVRPRPGDFVMDASERLAMQREAAAAVEAGAHGVVFGILTTTGHVAVEACRELLACCPGVETVFHRAFDFTPDAFETLETLVAMGVTRILSAGVGTWATPGEGEAFEARCRRLGDLHRAAGGRIQILPGGGFRPANAAEALMLTGCQALHSACRPAASGLPCGAPPRLDPAMVEAMRRAMDAAAGSGA
jgi:copper homeostasis protein